MNDLIDQFRLAIAAAGLTPPTEIIDDGAIHRFSTNGKPVTNPAVVLHSDGIAAGSFGDWRSGLTSTWCSKSDTHLCRIARPDPRPLDPLAPVSHNAFSASASGVGVRFEKVVYRESLLTAIS